MYYFSTRGESSGQDFSQILLAGAAPDGGLYMPEQWPRLSASEITALKNKSFAEVAFEILRRFTGESIPHDQLLSACREAYANFRVKEIAPLVQLERDHYLLELFHGATFAFKDIAMQLLARLIERRLRESNSKASIICATSGDTGAAAVGAFQNSEYATVIVLFPKDRISDMQRRQMTASGAPNVLPIAVEGSFDDAQAIVKDLFADTGFSARFRLAAVNSINWARIAAQITYYFTAALQLGAPSSVLSFCVPTGNFGDIFAGYAALKMGLPIRRLIIATNQNDSLARALQSGCYKVEHVTATTSPSMDIQVPSNFERLLFESLNRDVASVRQMMRDLKGQGSFTIPPPVLENIRAVFAAERASEAEVRQKIRNEYQRAGRFIDPHTAVGLVAAAKVKRESETLVTLSTAHPAKFPEVVGKACGVALPMPDEFRRLMTCKENYIALPARTDVIRDHLQTCLSKEFAA